MKLATVTAAALGVSGAVAASIVRTPDAEADQIIDLPDAPEVDFK